MAVPSSKDFSQGVRLLMYEARKLAFEMKYPLFGGEIVLAILIRDHESPLVEAFDRANIDFRQFRQMIAENLTSSPRMIGSSHRVQMTPILRKAMGSAYQLRDHFHHELIEVEHVQMGLLAYPSVLVSSFISLYTAADSGVLTVQLQDALEHRLRTEAEVRQLEELLRQPSANS